MNFKNKPIASNDVGDSGGITFQKLENKVLSFIRSRKDGATYSQLVQAFCKVRIAESGNLDTLDRGKRRRDIDTGRIICVSRTKKTPGSKTIACSIVMDRFARKHHEVMPDSGKDVKG